ncbi:MAG: hypothetical protein ABI556_12560 [Gemmatimonadales bacterium]
MTSPSPLLKVNVITPHSGLDAFREAFQSLVGNFTPARRLAWRFFLRDTRAEHRQSLFGYFWLVVPALANALTWVFLNGQKVIHIDSGGVSYPLFVLTGTILWTAFNGSVMSMLGVINAARGTLAKVNFPHESLIYAACVKSATDAALAGLVLLPALFVFHATFRSEMLLFPIAILASLLLGWALGLIVLPIAALYSDVSRALQLILRFGFFLTPVIFLLPSGGLARTLMLINPVTPMIVTGRAWLTGSPEGTPAAFMIVFAVSAFVFSIGMLFYKVALPHLIERLSG